MSTQLMFPNIYSDSPRLQETNMKIVLKEHQRALLYAIRERETNIHKTINNGFTKMSSRFGYFCSKVGSGKTTTMLAAISDKKYLNNDFKNYSYYSSQFLNICSENIIKEEFIDIKSNIIVVPLNIFNQWGTFIKSHSNLNFLSISAPSNKVFDILKSLYKIKCKNNNVAINVEDTNKVYYIKEIINMLNDYDIILVKNTSYNGFYDLVNQYNYIYKKILKFSRIIIDEVDTINIPNNRIICSYFTWFISASYENVMYYKSVKNNGDIRNTINSIYNYYTTIPKFHNDPSDNIKVCTQRITLNCCNDFIDSSFVLPDINKIIVNCYTPLYIKTLSDFVDSSVMSMLNSGNISGAINKLGFNVVPEETNLIDIVINQYNTKIDNLKKRYEYKNSLTYQNNADKKNILDKITKDISELENKKEQLSKRIKENMSSMCPICMADTPDDPVILNCDCKTVYCMKCLCMSIQNNTKCPMCRETIDMKNIIAVRKDADEINKEKNKESLPTKNQAMIDIINSNPNGKYIVFTYSPEILNNPSNVNDEESLIHHKNNTFWGDINCSVLKGSMATIEKRINEFKNGKIKVLLMNSESYCAGMNLQCTTDVIIYHNLNSDIEKQAIGRAQRIGRTSKLNVHYLKHNNE